MAKTKKTENGKKKSQKTKKQSKIAHYPCSYCSKTFSERSGRERHIKLHSSERPYACQLCDYTGKTQQYLTKHFREVHKPATKFTCEYCGRKFHFESKLKEHISIHTNERPHKCKECGKGFNSYYSLSTHVLIHQNLKPYKCKFCDYACRDGSTLRKHQERHLGTNDKYECNICGKKFSQKYVLNQHVAEVHMNMDLRTVPCDQCGKKFKSRSRLNTHIKVTHTRSLTTSCEICGAKISSKYNMASHLLSHVEARPHKCAFSGCTKRYKDRSSLRKHSLIHFPEKQHPCSVCGRRFTRPARLMKHEEQHDIVKEKKVQCDYCGVRFYNKNYLIVHIRRKHMRNKRRFICDMCDFETSNKPSLVMHIKGHNRKTNKKCSICQKVYRDPNWYKQHLWQVHKITEGNGPPLDVHVKTEPLDVDALPDFELFEIEKEELLEDLRSINAETEKDKQNQQNIDLFEETEVNEINLQQNDASSVEKVLELAELCAPTISDENVNVNETDSVNNIVNLNVVDHPNDIMNLEHSVNLHNADNSDVMNFQDDLSLNDAYNSTEVTNFEGGINLNDADKPNNVINFENSVNRNDNRNPNDVINFEDRVKLTNGDDPNHNVNLHDACNPNVSDNVNYAHSSYNNSNDIVVPNDTVPSDSDVPNNSNPNNSWNPNEEAIVNDNDNSHGNDNLDVIQATETAVLEDVTSNGNKNADDNVPDIDNIDNSKNSDGNVNQDDMQSTKIAISTDITNAKNNVDFRDGNREIDSPNNITTELDMNLVGMQRKRIPKVQRKGTIIVNDRDRQKKIQSRRLAWNKVRPNKTYKVFRIDALPGLVSRDELKEKRRIGWSKVKEIAGVPNNSRKNVAAKKSEKKNRLIKNKDCDVTIRRGNSRKVRAKDNVKRGKVNVNKNKVQEIDKTPRRKSSKELTDDEDMEYSQSVLSEDFTRSITKEKSQVGFEKDFDDFVLVNMFEKDRKSNDKLEELDVESQSYAKDYLNNLLKETREKREVKLIESAREKYNERMLRARDLRKEKVSIKYFDKSKAVPKKSEIPKTDHESPKNNSNNNVDNQAKDDDDDEIENNTDILRTDNEIESNSVTDVERDNSNNLTENIIDTEEDSKSNPHESERDRNINGIRLRPIRKKQQERDYNESRNKNVDESKKIKLNTHQCYVCFKLYDTKEKLLDHCKDHFEICNTTILKKCPLCHYATKANIIRHMRLEHDIDIAIPSKRIREKDKITNGSKYFYQVDSSEITDMEIIPSVKHLNKQAYINIDQRNRKLRDTGIAKTKLVKKGGEWVVERVTTRIDNVDDLILPQFEVDEILSIKIDTSTYLGRLQKLSRLAKKYKKKMLFPCEDCDKICQNFAGLKLHTRRHDKNSKPFKKKVWKHKMNNLVIPKDGDSNKNRRVFEVDAVKECNGNRYKKPKPVINKHKCDPELIKFYHANIKGGDVEFWQFLKIFNKMSRENVNDFDDLVDRPEFGIHMDKPGTSNELRDLVETVNNKASNKLGVKEGKVDKVSKKGSINSGNISKRGSINNGSKMSNFKRVIRIPKKEYLKRIELKKQLRDKLSTNNLDT